MLATVAHNLHCSCRMWVPGGGVRGTVDSPRPAKHCLAMQEARLLSSIRHPNIVQFMGLCTQPACIITEFCSRGSFTDVIREAKADPTILPWTRRLDMVSLRWGAREGCEVGSVCCLPPLPAWPGTSELGSPTHHAAYRKRCCFMLLWPPSLQSADAAAVGVGVPVVCIAPAADTAGTTNTADTTAARSCRPSMPPRACCSSTRATLPSFTGLLVCTGVVGRTRVRGSILCSPATCPLAVLLPQGPQIAQHLG